MPARKSRDDTKRDAVWSPPDKLATPEPPPGYKFKWVRYTIRGEEDVANIRNWKRQGYEFATAEVLGDLIHEFDTATVGDVKGVPAIGDLVLMIVPEEIADARNAYYSKQARRMQQAVDQELDAHDSESMPIERSMKTKVTKGRTPDFD